MTNKKEKEIDRNIEFLEKIRDKHSGSWSIKELNQFNSCIYWLLAMKYK